MRTGRVVLVSVVVALATLLGGWRVAAQTTPTPGPMTLRVGGASYTVTHVEQVAGLTDADLGGMSHGVQSLVPVDHALVRVSVTVSAGGSATQYDAAALRAFVSGASDGIAPAGGSLPPGRLQAHGRIDGSLSYVVPRNGRQLVLRAGTLAREVPLIRVDTTTAHPADHDHAHAPATPGVSASRASPSPRP